MLLDHEARFFGIDMKESLCNSLDVYFGPICDEPELYCRRLEIAARQLSETDMRLKIRVWDYDCGATMDYLTPYSPEKLAELKARWDDPCGISGAELHCPALAKAGYELRMSKYSSVSYEDIPF